MENWKERRKKRDKDLNKRRKRNTRGRRGIALPDREPMPDLSDSAIGFPELDAATLALAAAASAPCLVVLQQLLLLLLLPIW